MLPRKVHIFFITETVPLKREIYTVKPVLYGNSGTGTHPRVECFFKNKAAPWTSHSSKVREKCREVLVSLIKRFHRISTIYLDNSLKV